MRSMPHLVEVHEELAQQGLNIIALSNENESVVARAVKDLQLPFWVGAQSDSYGDYGVSGLPQAFLINKVGKIVWSGHPADDAWVKTAKQLLQQS